MILTKIFFWFLVLLVVIRSFALAFDTYPRIVTYTRTEDAIWTAINIALAVLCFKTIWP